MTWHRASCIWRRVADELISYVALDVHKDMIAVAVSKKVSGEGIVNLTS
jgi:hypothetical protein